MPKSTGKPDNRPIDDETEAPRVKRRQAPGRSTQSRENQLISLAYDLVEKRILQGTATSQEVTHFLKMGSSQAELEKAKLEKENQLLLAKTEAIKAQAEIKELYANALLAMRSYTGQEEQTDDSD